MNIKVWTDFTCPFCYIGLTNLYAALSELEMDATISYKSYIIMPQMEHEEGRRYMDQLAEDHGFSEEEKIRNQENVDRLAHAAGLSFDFENMKLASTNTAHRLLQYAKKEGKAKELFAQAYPGIFEKGAIISDHQTLNDYASKIGLNEEEVSKILEDESLYWEDVLKDIQESQMVGVRGVPFFVINDKYGLSGAQAKDYFKEALSTIQGESLKDLSADDSASCGEGTCGL